VHATRRAAYDPSPTYGQKDDAAQNTIGIVCVSRLTAAVPGVPLVEGLIRGDCTGSAVAVTMQRRARDVGGIDLYSVAMPLRTRGIADSGTVMRLVPLSS
jgi:hypothetical protein